MIATIQPEPYTEFLDFMNLVFTAFFAFEFVVKFAAFGLREYVKDPWNNFDFIIVIGSFLDIIMAQVFFHNKSSGSTLVFSDWSWRCFNFYAQTFQGDETGLSHFPFWFFHFFAISLQIFLVIIIISLFCRRFSIAFPIIIYVQVDLIQQLLLIIIV